MESDQRIWRHWVRGIQQVGGQEWAASLLEAAGPLAVLGAQVVYLSQPLLNNIFQEGTLDALARLLEEPAHTHTFIALLREAPEP